MTRALDPARLRQARLAELNYVRREVTQEAATSIARMRQAMDGLQEAIGLARQLIQGGRP